ncbi:hypothetical protein HUW46_00015 [Amycolatopsis sp. CA-230715]|nr:hypothetical protein HUW46_00015 [Amycolatopsis sp. CA-230715]
MEYLADPSRLDTVLGQLETVRKSVPGNEWLNVPCGQ